MRDLQRRLSSAGFLAPGAAEDSTYCARTHAAVLAFQESFGLRCDGVVDDLVWSTLIEASWTPGERVLYLRSPNLRGDDVASVQALLNLLGFDCGRVDGIFGVDTERALRLFQGNTGSDPTGICTPGTVADLSRLSSQAGSGPGIAIIREREDLSRPTPEHAAQLLIGGFGPVADIVRATQQRASASMPLATTVEGDAFAQARAANEFGADLYLGFEASLDSATTVHYYEVPGFHSPGGKALAEQIASTFSQRIPELSVTVAGVRLPILRETKMPAVLCCLGPESLIRLKVVAVANAAVTAVRAWLARPLDG